MDRRLPDDTLFMIFEEDFRFYPSGQDPDEADGYGERVLSLVVQRGHAASGGTESLPPQSPSEDS